MPIYRLGTLITIHTHQPAIMPAIVEFVPPTGICYLPYNRLQHSDIIFPSMHGRNTMAIKIHQYEVVLTPELSDESSKGIYLARCTRNEVLLFTIYVLESLSRIALDVLASYRRNQFFHCSCNVVLRTLIRDVIATAYNIIVFLKKLPTDFKTNAAA